MKFSFVMFSVLLAAKASASVSTRVIGGEPVAPGQFSEVVLLQMENAQCNATKVGPRTFVTAAHCSANQSRVEVVINGNKQAATLYRHKAYPEKDMDIALVISDDNIESIPSARIAGKAWEGLPLTIVGSGCTVAGGGGGNDGVFRMGVARVTSFSQNDYVTKGAGLCFGDSGGAAYAIVGDSKVLMGVNSKGNISDTNYHHNLSLPETQTFLRDVATEHGVDICGITTNCL